MDDKKDKAKKLAIRYFLFYWIFSGLGFFVASFDDDNRMEIMESLYVGQGFALVLSLIAGIGTYILFKKQFK